MTRWKAQRIVTARNVGLVILRVAAVLSLLVAGGAGRLRAVVAAQDKSVTNGVSIDNFSFTPMQLNITAGTQVTWTNKDDVPHTVISVDHKFKSPALDTDEKYSYTFEVAGTYEYFCSMHPKMTGKIIVK